jgi:transposase-like protein
VAIVVTDLVEVRPTNLSEREPTVTTTPMELAELTEQGVDKDVRRQMVQFMARRVMDLDVEARCGAGYDEKNPERLNSRNSYHNRLWKTRAGLASAGRARDLTAGKLTPKLSDRRADVRGRQ